MDPVYVGVVMPDHGPAGLQEFRKTVVQRVTETLIEDPCKRLLLPSGQQPPILLKRLVFLISILLCKDPRKLVRCF